MHINQGKDQGSMLDDGMVEITDIGCCRRKFVPYEAFKKSEMNMESMRAATQDADDHRAVECYKLPGRPEDLWMAAVSCIVGGGQTGHAVHVDKNYMASGKKAGVDKGPGNHAVPGSRVVKFCLLYHI